MSIFFPLFMNAANKNATNTINEALIKNSWNWALIGYIIALTPKTSVELTIIVPIWLPIVMLGCLSIIALVPNTNSGRVVPKDIKKRPINIGLSANSSEIIEAYLIILSADKNSNTKDAMKTNE